MLSLGSFGNFFRIYKNDEIAKMPKQAFTLNVCVCYDLYEPLPYQIRACDIQDQVCDLRNAICARKFNFGANFFRSSLALYLIFSFFLSSSISLAFVQNRNSSGNAKFKFLSVTARACFFQGETKVLVTGPWKSGSSYQVLVDGIPQPASLVQDGVLRFVCPGLFNPLEMFLN